MTRYEQRLSNGRAINRAIQLIAIGSRRHSAPSYKSVVATLNGEGLKNSRGRDWVMKTFYLMLSRNGYRGLYGLRKSYLAGAFDAQLSSISGGQ